MTYDWLHRFSAQELVPSKHPQNNYWCRNLKVDEEIEKPCLRWSDGKMCRCMLIFLSDLLPLTFQTSQLLRYTWFLTVWVAGFVSKPSLPQIFRYYFVVFGIWVKHVRHKALAWASGCEEAQDGLTTDADGRLFSEAVWFWCVGLCSSRFYSLKGG